MNEFVEQFLIESRELVAAATQDFTALEQWPEDKDLLDGAFRAIHTLKGGAGIIDFNAMTRALHGAEDVLSLVRSGDRSITPLLIGDFLACLDHIARWLDAMEISGEAPLHAESEADDILVRFAGASASQTIKIRSSDIGESARAILHAQQQLLSETSAEGRSGRWSSAAKSAVNVLSLFDRTTEAQDIERALGAALESGEPEALSVAIGRAIAAVAPQRQATLTAPADVAPRTFRIDAGRLDALVDLSGELAVAKNVIGHLAKVAQGDNNPLASALSVQHAQLGKLVAALQQSVLAVRVLPMRYLFQRFQRLVREMSEMLGKPARIVTFGEETEADKAVIEALHEPILHLLRNAMDHGIEPASHRLKAGKPKTAIIQLRAIRQNEHVVLEIADDGAGIDIDRVREVALERGLVSAETVEELSEAETINLIFEPGFSTARQITEHSGRGVGMDAVRTAIARLGGRVTVETKTGHGSTVRLTLPFSVIMTQVMTVEVKGQKFGIPLDAIVETIRFARGRIQPVGTGQAVVHRGRTLPIIDLAQSLGRAHMVTDRDVGSGEALVVSVALGGYFGAIAVDRLGERLDVMLKPMTGLLEGVPGISGTALLGDGSVLIILDVLSLISYSATTVGSDDL